MIPESSPFRPGQPARAEFFVGRLEEIKRLRSMVNASMKGRLTIGFVSGERGIGKSSLVSLVRRLAEKDGGVVGCHAFLGGVENPGQMFRVVMDSILKTSVEKPWHEQVKNFFGNRVKNVGMFGITLELNISDKEAKEGERYFIPAIKNLLKNLGGSDSEKTLFLILDDINGLAASGHFANWLKSTVDEIAVSEEDIPVCIIIVGLEDRRRNLIANQPSLARVFELIDIAPWSEEETIKFYTESFRKGGVEISEDAAKTMTEYTGGLPIIAHEIGDAVWRTAQNSNITWRDVAGGIVLAAEIIGGKFLEPQILAFIRSTRYQAILKKISGINSEKGLVLKFSRAQLIKILPETEKKVIDNFLRRMVKLGMLQKDPGLTGGYQFPNRLYALFVLLMSSPGADR